MKKFFIILFCVMISSCISNKQTEENSQGSGQTEVLSGLQNAEAVQSDDIVPVGYLSEDSQEVQMDTVVIANPSDENPMEANDSVSVLE